MRPRLMASHVVDRRAVCSTMSPTIQQTTCLNSCDLGESCSRRTENFSRKPD